MSDTPPPAAQRDARGRILPGVTINPGGRPAVAKHVQALARAHTEVAIRRIVELIGSDDEKVALAAAEALLDRGFGKPVQATNSTVQKIDYGVLLMEANKARNEQAQTFDMTPATIDHCENAEVLEDRAADGPKPEIDGVPADVVW
jgi:hypothetical protein